MSSDWSDQPATVRSGEDLNMKQLGNYLRTHLPGVNGELAITQFPSGFSNLTYLIRIGDQEFVLRRPPFGVNIKSAHDMGREFNILSRLHRVYAKAPRALLHCTDEAVIGTEFYVMERVNGVVLRNSMAEAAVPSPELMARIAAAFVDNMVQLHAVDYEAAGLGSLGRPTGYVRRQIGGWIKRYHNAKTDEFPELEWVASWLAEHVPPESGAALIHNDYKYNNLMLNAADWTEIIAVFDWEMSTLGDPLMDLGTTLGYWIEPDDPPLMQRLKFSPSHWPGNPSRGELVERYAQKSGREVANIVFYYAYGLFKLAGIIQQIYRRYKLGLTRDQRFAHLNEEVELCGQIARQAIEKDRIDRLF